VRVILGKTGYRLTKTALGRCLNQRIGRDEAAYLLKKALITASISLTRSVLYDSEEKIGYALGKGAG
jgi:hypothetical protein